LIDDPSDGDNGIAFRGTFIIDGKGILRHYSVNDLPVGRNVDEIIRYHYNIIFIKDLFKPFNTLMNMVKYVLLNGFLENQQWYQIMILRSYRSIGLRNIQNNEYYRFIIMLNIIINIKKYQIHHNKLFYNEYNPLAH
jgi:hypothetical protein